MATNKLTSASSAGNTDFSELDEIRGDIDALKTHIAELSRHLQAYSKEELAALTDEARKRVVNLQKAGKKEFKKLESEIQDRPLESVAIALAAGVVLSFLMGRR